MKKLNLVVSVLAVASLAMSSCCSKTEQVKLATKMDSVSYALGANQGGLLNKDMKNIPGDTINKDIFMAAFEKGLNGDSASLLLSQEVSVEVLQKYFSELGKMEEDKRKAKGIFNQLRSDSVLAANKQKDGVVVTESGLQYTVITEGTGAKPKATDKVKINYVGKLTDAANTIFDSSIERGEPAIFPVNGVVPGFSEALQLMSVGSKWQVLIPSNLAYGERGAGDRIEPNTALIFEIELLEILPEDKPRQGQPQK